MYPFIYILGKAIPTYGLMLVAAGCTAWLAIVVLSKCKNRLSKGGAATARPAHVITGIVEPTCPVQDSDCAMSPSYPKPSNVYDITLSHSKRSFSSLMLKLAEPLSTGDAKLTFLIGLCGGIVGAFTIRPVTKIIEVLANWGTFKNTPAGELVGYLFGEAVFYGGFIGGAAAVIWFCLTFKINFYAFFDLCAPPLSLAHAIGRLGCFLGGCCYGAEAPDGHFLSVVYPPHSIGAPPGVPLLATPLIESAFLFALFIILTIMLLASGRMGLSASIYMLVYPVGRFVLEFFRGDAIRGVYGGLSTSQYISAMLFVAGVIYILSVPYGLFKNRI